MRTDLSVRTDRPARVSVAAFVRSPQPHLRAGAVVEPYRADAYDLNIAIRTHPQVELSAIEKPLPAMCPHQSTQSRPVCAAIAPLASMM